MAWEWMSSMRALTSRLSPAPLTMVVSSLVAMTLPALPKTSRPASSSLRPRSLETS